MLRFVIYEDDKKIINAVNNHDGLKVPNNFNYHLKIIINCCKEVEILPKKRVEGICG